jgi:hypothetical protein
LADTKISQELSISIFRAGAVSSESWYLSTKWHGSDPQDSNLRSNYFENLKSHVQAY